MRPKIALNALALRPGGGGVQTYIRQLLAALPAAVDADIAAAVQADAVAELPAGVRPIVRPVTSGARRALWGVRGLGPADIVHGLDVDLPLRPGAPTVATVHDLSVFDVPWAFPRHRVAGERLLLSQALSRADAVVAVSAFTAQRVAERFRRQVTVVPLAAAPNLTPPSPEQVAAVRAAWDLPERFVLQVGTIEPRKDVAGLAAACQWAGVPLVVAGAVGRGGGAHGARALGYVDSSMLAGLYGAATVVAYVSWYEGFGLPPLEAMACGAPVVASRVGGIPEVMGPGAVLVAPGDHDELGAVLARLLSDPAEREELAAAGLARAAQFSWEATTAATVAVYLSLGMA